MKYFDFFCKLIEFTVNLLEIWMGFSAIFNTLHKKNNKYSRTNKKKKSNRHSK